MSRALWIAASGMIAQQINVDVVANNLANVNTNGYKKARTNFQDLMYQTTKFGGAYTSATTQAPSGLQVGLGTKLSSTQKIFSQGDFTSTQNQLDIIIRGEGFLQVAGSDGEEYYTRDGSLSIDANGQLVNSEGMTIEPAITVPTDYTSIVIGSDGTVSVLTPGDTTPQQVGQITIAKFSNPAGLENSGRNLYQATAASGEAVIATPGESGLGTLDQGFLESSNVDVAEEMIRMIVAQRAYEMNAKAITTTDTMMGLANNLKR